MNHRHPFALAALALLAAAPMAQAATADTAPVLVDEAGRQAMRDARQNPLFAAELARAIATVEAVRQAGIQVPVPKDPGGGYTHEQHKRNFRALYDAGALYAITGDKAYAEFSRDMLLAYAQVYPSLGPHPAGRGQIPGRLFWQTLNDSNWLFYAIQGYDAVRAALAEKDRKIIEDKVFRPMARFLSDGAPRNFNLIHNHATWAVAAVGMTGYVLRDRDLVDKALLGLDKSGKAGFLKQVDQLFSPDGYYEEGPYYQRYALLPFIGFARAIDQNDPQREIFKRRDSVLLKAVRTTVNLTYGGLFFPLNDAMKDKGLATEELYQAVAIAYARTGDTGFLSVAQMQGKAVLTPDGAALSAGVATAKATPFAFTSQNLGDGPDGTHGSLAILRAGTGPKHQVLVAKNTAQGMGHGHFDKLSWIFYDNGAEVVADYGAARFLNIETKSGGVYLPENTSWAKQTVAHNTLVVNETSHFDGELKRAQPLAPTPLFFHADDQMRIVSARMEGAYDGVTFTRTLALLGHADLDKPVVIDLMKVRSDKPARLDLPLHYRGHIMDVGFPLTSNTEIRPVLGKGAGYQHIWVDATGTPAAGNATLTWLQGDRFYTYRFLPQAGATAMLAESGANDPKFNLRREPILIQRLDNATAASFVGVLEPHGEYNGAAEYTLRGRSRIADLSHVTGPGGDVVTLTLATGARLRLAISDNPAADAGHEVVVDGAPVRWQGPFARFDLQP
ncbi:heparinase II/III family protein [Niveispirillum sp.]|uniref:heparinase II/III domain-containing protein n=1 Tax=Niveispirillum sp. TaxID=1917217 RepID=UPI001B7B8147|nr:heparinase II/III family protein [Niveispirillum sp.]MBP7336124.1 alginate lyase family protein [Niveispirillum sp.]